MIKFQLKKFLPVVFLVFVLSALFITNYTPGTYLTGWDNLMPELNLGVNIKRSLLAVWQEYQGLGLVGGMGHATELIRQLIIFPLNLIFPVSFIRYFWHFSMLTLGTLGVYFILGQISLNKNKTFNLLPRVLGALFYLLNFGTIQFFWPPYEAFSTFWGFFPWLIFSFWNLIKKNNKRSLYVFIILNILATPSFYIPTLFVVYLLCLAGVSLGSKKPLPLSFKGFFIIFIINAFWLLPFLYYLLTNLNNTQEAIANQISTEETFLRNQGRGTIKDFLLMRGYYYDFPDRDVSLMETWHNHFEKTGILLLGYFLGGIAVFGLLLTLIRKHLNGFSLGIFIIWLLGLIALLSAIPPFEQINDILRHIPLINQVFRSPFTKFIVPTAFAFAYFFAISVQSLADIKIRFFESNKLLNFVIAGVLVIMLGIYSSPAFSGNFIYPKMRVDIPGEYLELIEYLKDKPSMARIANLPQGDFWGWTLYRWGGRGSGFIWYGIEQPILDRAFDVWSLNNEQYYWELSYALQTQNISLIENIFDKYFIEYVLFDDNVFFPGEKEYAKISLNTKKLLEDSEKLKKVAEFGNLTLYRFHKSTVPTIVFGDIVESNFNGFYSQDLYFNNFGNYISNSQKPNIYYPFNSMFSNRFQNELTFSVEELDDKLVLEIPVEYFENFNLKQNNNFSSETIFLNQDISQGYPIAQVEIPLDELSNFRNCASEKSNSEFYSKSNNDITFEAVNASPCVDWKYSRAFNELDQPYIVKIEFEYKSKTDEWPQYCLLSSKGNCLNNKDFPLKGFSNHWEIYSEEILIDPKQDKVVNFSLILDAYNENIEKQISYRKIKLTFYPVDASRLSKNISYNIIQNGENIYFEIPKLLSNIYIGDLVEKNLYKLRSINCNSTLPNTGKIELIDNQQEKFIRQSVTHGDSCLIWNFPELSLDRGWLVKVEYRNKKGYPLLVSGFDGHDRYKFFYTKLTSEEEWQDAYFVIPAYSQTHNGLALLFDTISYNNSESINDIKSLKIFPLPWEYLQSISYQSGNIIKSETHLTEFSGNIWHYEIKNINTATQTNKTLILPQSYDKGWIAITDNFKLLDHYEISNWANGWQIEGNPEKIYIIFWPQILQFIGFGGLGLAMLLVTSKKRLII